MLNVIFKSMLITSIRDKITLFYSLMFPLILMLGLGLYFDSPDMKLNIVSGVTAISTIFWGMQGIAFQVHFQRNKGVYKLLKLTPMPTISFICVMTAARTVIGLVLNMIVWIIGMVFLKFDLTLTNILITSLLIAVGLLSFTAIGFFIANLANNEGQINMFSNLLQLPMIFMSEAFYKLNSAPNWVVATGKLLPFEHYVKALKGAINGMDDALLLGFLIPLLYMVIAILLSVLTFRWEANGTTIKSRKKLSA
ncbi:ABC transporter permease [Bacillus sp. 31A1R]|uniref:Transport permease protein n=1 Tax=Robertmurraya mangrovi TaxID=3098077 RepID=A0ABU5ITU5_9BACI|nr:ABC transporter permease [Bacillus sp. 31A1R]MDZ5470575.1 ABC transporter permease [Bacillus sp. 31A1R]